MNDTGDALLTYQKNITSYSHQLSVLLLKKSRIGWLRLLIVLLTIAGLYAIWHQPPWVILALLVAGISAFLLILSADADNNQRIENLQRLLTINTEETSILRGDYYTREDGKIFETRHHAYSQDLDIFGTASLYQYINRCTAEQAKQLLAAHLKMARRKEDIVQTQQSVKELSGKMQWRQQFHAYGMATPVTIDTELKIRNWLLQPLTFQQPYWQWLSIVFPLLTLGSVALYLANIITSPAFSFIVLICFFFAFSLSKKIHVIYQLLSHVVAEVSTLYNQLHHFETEDFASPFIMLLKQKLESKNNQKSSTEINKLKNILNRFDARLNVFAFFFLNTFLLWDLRQILALNKWKVRNTDTVSLWFNTIAEMEVLSSLASLSYNQPSWCFPIISNEHFTLAGKDIGHPLIDAGKRVSSSFALQGIAKVALVTGSNMGGKSTFLRSIGLNMVLALMGAPVCAQHFTTSPARLMSSMRVADNLSENASTFYAELKKLQQVIEAVNRKEKIFILLDEILRGTNSMDRHTGSSALIQQLIRQQAVAIIATHDIELTALDQQYPQAIANYHFDVQVDKNDELFFDYKLKDGICKSMNASILMKKIGIEME